MSKTITLQDIEIISWSVDVGARRVSVDYQILDSDSNSYQRGMAIFWDTMPDPSDDPINASGTVAPVDWYQLPVKYVSLLTDLTQDVRAALLHLLD